MKRGKAFLGLLAGFAAGVIVGTVLSTKGSKQRKNISRKGKDLTNALSDTID